MRWLIIHPGPHFSVADVYTGWLEALRKLGQDVAIYNLHDRITFYDRALLEVEEDNESAKGPATVLAQQRSSLTPLKSVTQPIGENVKIKIRKALTSEQALSLASNGILSACYQLWPDVILSISSFFMIPDLLRIMHARKHKVVLVHTESPYQDEEQLTRAEFSDYNILNDPTNLEMFRAVAPTDYYPQAYRPLVHRPGPSKPDLECDFAFVGTAFESRVKFFEEMNFDGIDVLLAGNWSKLDDDSPLNKYLATEKDECIDNEQTIDVYHSAKMGLNFYRREHDYWNKESVDGWAMGPREIEMAACGLPFLRDPRPESDEYLSMLPTFSSPEDATEKLKWWLDHPRTRERASWQAHEAIKDRTFENNAKRLLKVLDG